MFKFVFLILLHYIPHEKCITHGIKYKGHDKYINSMYNRVGRLNMNNAYINENRLRRYQIKVNKFYF